MARTIVERIKAERRARKSAAEGLSGGGRPPREADRPANASGGDFIATFSSEVIPAIGETIAEEIGSSLDKVSLELVTRLEQALARGARGPSATALRRQGFLEDLEKRDTDLDMPSDEVVREIDRVLSEFGPVEGQPVLLPGTSPAPPVARAASDSPPPPEAVLTPDLAAFLAPAIAEGISGFAEDIEKGQERIVDALHRLKARVAVIEGEMGKLAERLEGVAALLLREEQS